LDRLRAQLAEAEAKQRIDERQCDEMTATAGQLAKDNNTLRLELSSMQKEVKRLRALIDPGPRTTPSGLVIQGLEQSQSHDCNVPPDDDLAPAPTCGKCGELLIEGVCRNIDCSAFHDKPEKGGGG